jgi:hypothetical protein
VAARKKTPKDTDGFVEPVTPITPGKREMLDELVLNSGDELKAILTSAEYIDGCFDSIEDGKPLYFERSTYGKKPAMVSCLELILEAARLDGDGYPLNVTFFDRMEKFDSSSELCRLNNDGGKTNCVPNLIEVVGSFKTKTWPIGTHAGGRPKKGTTTYTKMSRKAYNTIVEILAKHPEYYTYDYCRIPRSKDDSKPKKEMENCFELLVDRDAAGYINLDAVGKNFLDEKRCKYQGADVTCYDYLIRESRQTKVADQFLATLVNTGHIDERLYKEGNAWCSPGNSCVDELLNAGGSMSVKAVIEKFHADESENSPFSGEKCSNPDGTATNCFDLAVTKSVSDMYLNHSSALHDNIDTVAKMMDKSPRYENNLCRRIDVVSHGCDSATNKAACFSSLSSKIGKNIELMMFGGSLGTTGASIKKLVSESCIVNGREITVLDHVVDKMHPLYVIMANSNRKEALIKLLNDDNCTDSAGTTMNCLQKIVSDKMIVQDGDKVVVNNAALGVMNDIPNEVINGTELTMTESAIDMMDEKFSANERGFINSASVVELLYYVVYNDIVSKRKLVSGDKESRFWKMYHMLDVMTQNKPSDVSKLFYAKSGTGKPLTVELLTRYALNGEEVKNIIDNCTVLCSLQTSDAAEVAAKWVKDFEKDPETTSVLEGFFEKHVIANSGEMADFYYKSIGDPRFKNVHSTIKMDKPVVDIMTKILKKRGGWEPTLKSRMDYDKNSFGSLDRQYNTGHFVRRWVDNIEKGSTLQPDPLGITGIYDINSPEKAWGPERLRRYHSMVNLLFYGTPDEDESDYDDEVTVGTPTPRQVGAPYIPNKEKWKDVQKGGLDYAINHNTKPEPIGKRDDNIIGRMYVNLRHPSMDELENENEKGKFKGIPSYDYAVEFEYQIEFPQNYYLMKPGDPTRATREKYEAAQKFVKEKLNKTVGFLNFIKDSPKKILKELQAKYPVLYGQLQAVLDYENKMSETRPDQYKLVISNKPMDILRASANQGWDSSSCLHLPGGSNSQALESYAAFGTYIAYLVRENPYEPKWFARLFMHFCPDNKTVAVQDPNDFYDIDVKYHPHWDLAHDAVRVILANEGVNSRAKVGKSGYVRCHPGWKNDHHYFDYYDTNTVRIYEKGDPTYNGILMRRTNQKDDPSVFVNKVTDTF